MIKYIHLENIKSIRNLSLGMGSMNLLFGMNGMGKSTVIQSLLMLRQSYFKNRNLDHLLVTDGLVSLGTAKDILCNNAEEDRIVIHVVEDTADFDLHYAYDLRSGEDIELPLMDGKSAPSSYPCALLDDDFAYLSAEHLGPMDRHNASDGPTVRRLNRIGNRGDYAVSILASDGDRKIVNTGIIADEADSSSLIDQVTWWMGRISPGVRVHAELERATNEARLSFSYMGNQLNSERFRPMNVGFGIPYALPVVVALLTAKPGSIVIIENPESHLHPRGQAEMAALMARVSGSGVQVICESHSDHIINGVRVAVKEGRLSASDTVVSYFSRNEDQETTVEEIRMDRNGNLESFPEGLLDEWGLLLERLI